MCTLKPRAPDTASRSGGKDRRERDAGCPPSTPVGPLRFIRVIFSVTASNLVQLVRLHEIGAGLSTSSACGAATWPHQENPSVTGFWGARANGYLRRCRVTASWENPRALAFAGPGNHSRGDAPVIFIWVFDFVPTRHPG